MGQGRPQYWEADQDSQVGCDTRLPLPWQGTDAQDGGRTKESGASRGQGVQVKGQGPGILDRAIMQVQRGQEAGLGVGEWVKGQGSVEH